MSDHCWKCGRAHYSRVMPCVVEAKYRRPLKLTAEAVQTVYGAPAATQGAEAWSTAALWASLSILVIGLVLLVWLGAP